MKRLNAAALAGCLVVWTGAALGDQAGTGVEVDGVDPSGIRIPGIIRSWKKPDDELPSITIDEIDQCFGHDHGLQGRRQAITQQRAQVEAERAEVMGQPAALEKTVADINAKRSVVEDASARLAQVSAELARRRAAIEQARARPRTSAAETKALSGLIDAYNHDTRDHNQRIMDVKVESHQLQARIDAYNLNLARHNEHVDAFNGRVQAFKKASTAYNEEIADHQAQCAGERTVKR